MAINEIQISRTEKVVRRCMCDVWTLQGVSTFGEAIELELPASSILHTVLDMLALHLEHFETVQAAEKVSVPTTLKMLTEAKAVLASTILSNQARIKKGN